MSMSISKAYSIAIALLIVGLIIGYAIGIYFAPIPPGEGGGVTPPPTGLVGEIKIGALLSCSGIYM